MHTRKSYVVLGVNEPIAPTTFWFRSDAGRATKPVVVAPTHEGLEANLNSNWYVDPASLWLFTTPFNVAELVVMDVAGEAVTVGTKHGGSDRVVKLFVGLTTVPQPGTLAVQR